MTAKENSFIEDNLIILSKQTLDAFVKSECPADLIALYVFYYYCSKWQRTNCVRATRGYVKRGLRWGSDRFNLANKILCNMELIEPVVRKNASGLITGHYIKINYLWKQETLINRLELEPCDPKPDNGKTLQKTSRPENHKVDSSTGGFQPTNAYSAVNKNSLSDNKENTLLLVCLDSQFDAARKIYPGIKRGLAAELKDFNKKYKKDAAVIVPLLKPAIEKQIDHANYLRANNLFSSNWKHFKTWLNQACWTTELPATNVINTPSGKICIVDGKPGVKYQESSSSAKVYLCGDCFAVVEKLKIQNFGKMPVDVLKNKIESARERI